MKYCKGGDLSIFIYEKQTLPEKIVRRFLQQLGKIPGVEEEWDVEKGFCL